MENEDKQSSSGMFVIEDAMLDFLCHTRSQRPLSAHVIMTTASHRKLS